MNIQTLTPEDETKATFASSWVWPVELYQAARETCLRLYVANGGDRNAQWTVQPYPGTAAISVERPNSYMPPRIILCMPAFDLNKKLPRWVAELILAYTVHELLHALWTRFETMNEARREGLHSLLNAIEDNRIEANVTNLKGVPGARVLLEALTAHIVARAADGAAMMNMDKPENFAFILNCIIFHEKLGYRFGRFPADWRKRVPAHWLSTINMALVEFKSLRSTQDALALCRRLRDAMPQAPQKPQEGGLGVPRPQDAQNEPEAAGEPLGGLSVEPDAQDEGQDETEGGASGDKSQDEGQDETEAEDGASGDKGQDEGQDEPKSGASGDKGRDKPQKPQDEPKSDADEDSAAGDGGGEAGLGGEPQPGEMNPGMLSDENQSYDEASLDDLAPRPKPRLHMTQQGLSQFLNAPKSTEIDYRWTAEIDAVKDVIKTPARLRRHVTNAVKSLERVAYERRQEHGRFDARQAAAVRAGASNVFKRRVETVGQEAAVSLLLDDSGSMGDTRPTRRAAAAAMALHMGDALRAANVKFEIAAFQSMGSGDTTLAVVKTFAQPWDEAAKKRLGGYASASGGGTTMMPAMRAACERLRKQGHVTRRILITLTDGIDGFSPQATAALCQHYEARGVENLGIGLMLGMATDHLRIAFRGKCVFVDKVRELSERGLGELVKVLSQAAPRRAA